MVLPSGNLIVIRLFELRIKRNLFRNQLSQCNNTETAPLIFSAPPLAPRKITVAAGIVIIGADILCSLYYNYRRLFDHGSLYQRRRDQSRQLSEEGALQEDLDREQHGDDQLPQEAQAVRGAQVEEREEEELDQRRAHHGHQLSRL